MPRSLGELGPQRQPGTHPGSGKGSAFGRHADDEAGARSQKSDSGLAIERLAYTIEEAAIALGIGRDLIYDPIPTGHLRSKKAGARRIIGRHHLLESLDSDRLAQHRRAS